MCISRETKKDIRWPFSGRRQTRWEARAPPRKNIISFYWTSPFVRAFLPRKSLMATTSVSVEPSGTMPLTGGAQGPLPCWISIQQSTLSPAIKRKVLMKWKCWLHIFPRLTSKIELNHVQISDDHRGLWCGLLVIIEPFAAETFRFVPNLQQVFIVLNDDLLARWWMRMSVRKILKKYLNELKEIEAEGEA